MKNNMAVFPEYNDQVPGMDMRDYFAAQALNGIISCFREFESMNKIMRERGCKGAEVHAVLAYRFADAMMKIREEKS